MAEIKLTKNELRIQQTRLAQLERYLPTLQLKKAMLQAEVQEARLEIDQLEKVHAHQRKKVDEFSLLFSSRGSLDFSRAVAIEKINKRVENIAGVDVPYFDGIVFAPYDYTLFDTSIWIDAVVAGLRKLMETSVAVKIAEEKKAALEKELREVSIRVNLFEKILIPRSLKNIKKIKVFLGDLQLSAVSQAKIAKAKIIARQAKKIDDTQFKDKEAYA